VRDRENDRERKKRIKRKDRHYIEKKNGLNSKKK